MFTSNKNCSLCESQSENSKEEVYHSFDFIMLLSFEHVDIQHKCQRHRFATHYIIILIGESFSAFILSPPSLDNNNTIYLDETCCSREICFLSLFHYRKIGCFEGRMEECFLRIGTNKRQSNLQSASH